jgi:hypothetical protein
MTPTAPDTLTRLRERTAARKADGLVPAAYPVPAAKDPPGRKTFTLPVCPLRGDPTGETRPCPTCTGVAAVPLLACSVHGTCTDSKLLAGVKCCRICTDRPAS